MYYKPLKYKFTKTDSSQAEKIGYKLKNNGSIIFETFMQRFFPNLNLVSLLRILENQFTLTSTTAISRIIYFNDKTGLLKIEYRNDFTNEDDALLFVREFVNKGGVIEVKHEFCIIPKKSRNNGLIKAVFQESLQQYVNVNAKKIILHAGLSGGGYIWAKYGFVATDRLEVNEVLNLAKFNLSKSDFNVVKRIYDFYYTKNPNGQSFPMDLWASLDFMKPVLMGSDWHGELDLKNKEQFRNFKNYVSR